MKAYYDMIDKCTLSKNITILRVHFMVSAH